MPLNPLLQDRQSSRITYDNELPRQPNVFHDWPGIFGSNTDLGVRTGGVGLGGTMSGAEDQVMGGMDPVPGGGAGAGAGTGGTGQSMQRIGSSPAAAGPSRAGQGFGGGWDILRRRDSGSVPPVPTSSPSQAFGAGMGSYGASQALNALLSGGSTTSSSSGGGGGLGMSISPPNWGNPWSGGGRGSFSGGAGGGGIGFAGSFVGSLGALGTSFGRERDRQLEAKWGKEFWCCGKQFTGLHEFMEHCEDEHPNLSSDARVAAFNAQNPHAGMKHARPSFSGGPGAAFGGVGAGGSGGQPNGLNANAQAVAAAAAAAAAASSGHGDAPIPPGMMDIEMDEPMGSGVSAGAAGLMQQPVLGVGPGGAGMPQGQPGVSAPWASAFRNPYQPAQTAGVAPSLLSLNTPLGPGQIPHLALPQLNGAALPPGFALPSPGGGPGAYPQPANLAAHLAAVGGGLGGFASLPASRNTSMPGTPILSAANATSASAHASPKPMTREELEAKALRKAQRKAEKLAAAKEEAALASGSEADHPEKRFPCPIEGCGKVYKQANGLKYHLTRSINSGHGNVAALGGIMGLLGEKGMEGLV